MLCRSSSWVLLRGIWGVAVGAALLFPLLGTAQKAQPRPAYLPSDGINEFNKKYDRAVRERFTTLSRGQEPASKDKAEDLNAIKVTAQYYAYRLTWDDVQAADGGIHKVMQQLKTELNVLEKNQPASQECAKLFLQQMVLSLKEVLGIEKPIATINGARMLVLLGEAGSEEAADALLAALKDPEQNDGAKYWALVGLGKQLDRWNQAPPPPPGGRSQSQGQDQAICGGPD